jgi:hypothetical protein
MFRKFDDDEQARRLVRTAHGESRRGLYCAACQAFITHPATSLLVQGARRHTCTNPANITFTIDCFREAPGCVETGIPTGEFTWFSGYRWSVALCGECRRHLGWCFTGAADLFYGLIVGEIVER